jgi:hypothetical protein
MDSKKLLMAREKRSQDVVELPGAPGMSYWLLSSDVNIWLHNGIAELI